MKILCGGLVVLLFTVGCGKEEQRQAQGLYQALADKSADFAQSNAMEKDLLASMRSWCAGIVAGGGGRGAALGQNATVAQDLAKSVASVSAQVGQVRQAIYDLPIQKDFPLGVRSGLIAEFTRRQRGLQELRSTLQDTAAGFEAFQHSRDYKGDSYPAGIDKLNQLLQRYKDPGNSVADAMAELDGKYGFSKRPAS
jgi:hypothetical protein